MIIDVHCHIWEERLLSDELRNIIIAISKQYRFDLNLIINASSDRLIKEMDEAGIDKSILLGLDYDFHFKGKIGYKEYNDYVAHIIDEYPERFIGFAGIDPRRGKAAIYELERCINENGFKGVKFWGLTGFYPDDLQYYPFYERVEELGIPILCHTGTGPTGTYIKYCRPVFVDTIAVDFPKIKFIMAHVGLPWTSEAINVAAKNPNVYIDISMLEPLLKMAPFNFFQTLIEAKLTCGVNKILFGTDWPLFDPILSLKEYVDRIKEMKLPPPMTLMGLPEFTVREKNKILGDNAVKLLGL